MKSHILIQFPHIQEYHIGSVCVCVLQKREIYWESTGKQEHKDRINKLNIQVFDWQENDIFTFPVVVYIFAPYPDTYDTDKNTSIYIFVQNVVFFPLTLIVQRQSCIFLNVSVRPFYRCLAKSLTPTTHYSQGDTNKKGTLKRSAAKKTVPTLTMDHSEVRQHTHKKNTFPDCILTNKVN